MQKTTGRKFDAWSSFVAAVVAIVPLVSAASAQQGTPKVGGTLNFAVTAEPPDYDCHTSQTFATYHTLAPIFSYLIKYDPSQGGKIVGDLAESWTIAPDGLTYTFKLHGDVKFHDGSALTSADVKATFDRIANPPEGVVVAAASANPIWRISAASRLPIPRQSLSSFAHPTYRCLITSRHRPGACTARRS